MTLPSRSWIALAVALALAAGACGFALGSAFGYYLRMEARP